MEKEFKDRNEWALILGGSSGLGLATAKKLAAHGMNICIVHRTLRTEMDALLEEIRSMEEQGVSILSFNKDAGREEHIRQVLEGLKSKLGERGRVRALVHSIARGNLKPLAGEDEEEMTHKDFLQTIEAMALSLYDWAKSMRGSELFSERATILSFTSEGNSRVIGSYGAVSAAKSALESISRQMAVEFAPVNNRVHCIQAGVTDTRSLRMIPGSERLREIAIQRNPYKRLTRPEDVANAVYLLCKDESNWINGTTIVVDGGEHLR